MNGNDGRTGRRPGPGSTREALLEAARVQFAEDGYKGATLRTIAARAGVDPGLVRHFFGGKDGLFAAAMKVPDDALRRFQAVFDRPVEVWGEELARTYITLWEGASTSESIRASLVSALTDERARLQLRDFLLTAVLERAQGALPDDRAAYRVSLALSHLFGTALARYILQLPGLTDVDDDRLVADMAPTLQRYLTDPRL